MEASPFFSRPQNIAVVGRPSRLALGGSIRPIEAFRRPTAPYIRGPIDAITPFYAVSVEGLLTIQSVAVLRQEEIRVPCVATLRPLSL